MTETRTKPDAGTEPCQCHTSFAYISPMHEGHCCFQPATQTCHPAEVAAWEAGRDLRWRRDTGPVPGDDDPYVNDVIGDQT